MNISDRLINKIWRNIYIPKSTIRINKRAFMVPRLIVNNFLKSTYQSESWLSHVLEIVHKTIPINSFLDVGTNVGQTLLKIKSINSDVFYYGFEPNPYCIMVLQNIIKTNKLNNSYLIPCGLYKDSDLLKLEIQAGREITDSSASIISGFRNLDSSQSQLVVVSKLDDIISKLSIDNIDLIKIDIEGAELEAIIGMKESLQRHEPIIIVEVLPPYSETNKFRIDRQNKLSDILTGIGYKIFHIKKEKQNFILQREEKFLIHDNVNESDYLLLPSSININQLGFNFV